MELAKLLRNFKNKRVLVVGDLMLDRYIWGNVSRISPEAPVPVVDVVDDTFMLGSAANVANNIVSLGGRATVVGVTGSDRAADVLEALLDEKRIERHLFREDRPTTVKTRVIAHNQQVVRFDRENRDRIGGRTLKAVLETVQDIIGEHEAVVVSDYKKGMVSAGLMRGVLKAAKGKFVSVDPKVGHFHLYKDVSLITPNLAEASRGAAVEIIDDRSLLRAGSALLAKLNVKAVLITRGEDGMTLFEKKGHTHIPTLARRVYDVTGAGDTVIAAFSIARAAGATSKEAAVIANHAAGIVVGEVGAAAATPEQMRKSFKSKRNSV